MRLDSNCQIRTDDEIMIIICHLMVWKGTIWYTCTSCSYIRFGHTVESVYSYNKEECNLTEIIHLSWQ